MYSLTEQKRAGSMKQGRTKCLKRGLLHLRKTIFYKQDLINRLGDLVDYKEQVTADRPFLFCPNPLARYIPQTKNSLTFCRKEMSCFPSNINYCLVQLHPLTNQYTSDVCIQKWKVLIRSAINYYYSSAHMLQLFKRNELFIPKRKAPATSVSGGYSNCYPSVSILVNH